MPKKKAVETDESVSKDAALKKQEEEDCIFVFFRKMFFFFENFLKNVCSIVPDDFDEQLKQWCSTLLDDFKTHPLDKDTPPLGLLLFEKL